MKIITFSAAVLALLITAAKFQPQQAEAQSRMMVCSNLNNGAIVVRKSCRGSIYQRLSLSDLTGPQGEAGPQGGTGPQGDTGPQGLPGLPGTDPVTMASLGTALRVLGTYEACDSKTAGRRTFCDFTGQLGGWNVFDENYSGSNFSGVNLSQGNLQTINFSFANLTGADFTDANIQSPNFSFADLTGAVFTDANLQSPTYLFTICPDGSNSGLSGSCSMP
jgi:hypothetical protein